MIKHNIKNLKKYVIATLDKETKYLKSLHFGRYNFVSNIEGCSYFRDKKTANEMIEYYKIDTNDYDIDLVVLPLEVNYFLLEGDD